MRDFKYLLAYLLPASAAWALTTQGIWSWSTVVLAFGILPALELALKPSVQNRPEAEEAVLEKRQWFDWLLYLNIPLVFMIVIWYLKVLSMEPLDTSEIIGLTLSVGIVIGANGINVGHELGHRLSKVEQWLGQVLLLPALYQHFFIEHNRGHHKYVATRRDPATARYGEPVYIFWVRSIWRSWTEAWVLEGERLKKENLPFWSWHNLMLRFQTTQIIWLAGCGWMFGWSGFFGAFAVGIVGILLLETINYIEHYGLLRAIMPSGRPEPVTPAHSWNSDHEIGRIFLYELTRHSDHHYKATRKYQILRHLDESPQLPFGYPACMLIALVPPLWFAIMNRRVPRAMVVQ